ncbi:PREDICTED: EKC/KEOPS complex subunit LAGE3 [Gekko japonicus]|uniref:EKC/KEOPS complex subunit LAGE3 n=1 Tax=Gekko japonicus TaxID=146911 RepID=A0ABM1JHS1_GEKJA|nr:PREDICTED: EKC/KEOPS complex subunit LAGE3 [Gekko japonicus]
MYSSTGAQQRGGPRFPHAPFVHVSCLCRAHVKEARAAAMASGAAAGPGAGLAFELSIPFPSSPLARIALGSLAPDPEPRKGGISKELDVTENVLHVRWKAEEARILRVSISSFLEHLSLVVETMDLFRPPVA